MKEFSFRKNDAYPDEFNDADRVADGVDKVVRSEDGDIAVPTGRRSYGNAVISKRGARISVDQRFDIYDVKIEGDLVVNQSGSVVIENVTGSVPFPFTTPDRILFSANDFGTVRIEFQYDSWLYVPIPNITLDEPRREGSFTDERYER